MTTLIEIVELEREITERIEIERNLDKENPLLPILQYSLSQCKNRYKEITGKDYEVKHE